MDLKDLKDVNDEASKSRINVLKNALKVASNIINEGSCNGDEHKLFLSIGKGITDRSPEITSNEKKVIDANLREAWEVCQLSNEKEYKENDAKEKENDESYKAMMIINGLKIDQIENHMHSNLESSLETALKIEKTKTCNSEDLKSLMMGSLAIDQIGFEREENNKLHFILNHGAEVCKFLKEEKNENESNKK